MGKKKWILLAIIIVLVAGGVLFVVMNTEASDGEGKPVSLWHCLWKKGKSDGNSEFMWCKLKWNSSGKGEAGDPTAPEM